MTDVSAAGRADAAAHSRSARSRNSRNSIAHDLNREHQVDAILLKDQLDYIIFSDQRLQDWAWDPLTLFGAAEGSALFGLMSRDFAPLADRCAPQPGGWKACRHTFANRVKRCSLPACR